MNVFGERARGWRKARKRGVSPIIATILLVAITVVLAAVLYVLVSGLTRGGGSTPYTIDFTSTSATGSSPNFFDSMAVSPTTGLTTSAFGISITSSGGSTLALASAVGGSTTNCAPGNAFATGSTACNGPSAGWYGILETSGGTIAATWLTVSGTGAWGYASGTNTIPLSSAYTFVIISATQLNGNDYTITAYSTGSSSVSGGGTC
jgi:flagellin-like protein